MVINLNELFSSYMRLTLRKKLFLKDRKIWLKIQGEKAIQGIKPKFQVFEVIFFKNNS